MLIATTAAPLRAEYDPKLGRWLQRDPIGTGVPLQPALAYHAANPTVSVSMARELQYGDGMNFYEFVRSNAVNHTDPTGLFVGYQRFVADVTGSAIAAYAFGLDAAIYSLLEEGGEGTGLDRALESIPYAVAGSFVGGAVAWGLRFRPTGNILGASVSGGFTTLGLGQGFAGGAISGGVTASTLEALFAAAGSWRTGMVVGGGGIAAGAGRRSFFRALQNRGLGVCFAPNTFVIMEDERLVPIQDVASGQRVLAFDLETGTRLSGRVLQKTSSHVGELLDMTVLFDKSTFVISGTREHPFYVPSEGRFIPLANLVPGMRLLTTDESPAVVVQLVERNGDFTVYNLEIEHYATYHVTGANGSPGILVHNNPCSDFSRKLWSSLPGKLQGEVSGFIDVSAFKQVGSPELRRKGVVGVWRNWTLRGDRALHSGAGPHAGSVYKLYHGETRVATIGADGMILRE